jgi:hypothetical protein
MINKFDIYDDSKINNSFYFDENKNICDSFYGENNCQHEIDIDINEENDKKNKCKEIDDKVSTKFSFNE